jgi:hypothetical protein
MEISGEYSNGSASGIVDPDLRELVERYRESIQMAVHPASLILIYESLLRDIGRVFKWQCISGACPNKQKVIMTNESCKAHNFGSSLLLGHVPKKYM